jgi:hypothetical protein
MVYRSDVAALEARHLALEAEVAERTRARDEAAHLLAEARARALEASVLADLASGGPARRRRRRLIIAAAIAVVAMVAAAVGYRTAQPTPADRAARVLERMTWYTDEMCECSSTACVQQVSDRMARWGAEMSRTAPEPSQLDAATMKRATEISERLGACMMKAMNNGGEKPSIATP